MNTILEQKTSRPDKICYQLLALIKNIIDLRGGKITLEPKKIRDDFKKQLSEIIHHYTHSPCNALQIEILIYGLIAAIDEAALSNPGTLYSFWIQETLQYEYYHSNIGGDKFYTNLEQLLKHPIENHEILSLYQTLLTGGFEGKYSHEPAKRNDLIRYIAALLIKNHKKTELPPTNISDQQYNLIILPGWSIVLIAAGLILGGWYCASRVTSHHTKYLIEKYHFESNEQSKGSTNE